MNNENNKFTIKNEMGEEIECEVLFTFDSEETGKSYIAYTDNTKSDDGSTKVYASIYDPSGKSSDLLPIETDREWKIIENILASAQEKLSGKNENEEE